VPLAPQALAILRNQPRRQEADGSPRDLVFGWGKNGGFCNFNTETRELRQHIDAKRQAAGKEPMPHWTLHDFRRSISTGLNSMGIPPHVVEALLGHVMKGVAGVYNLAIYLPEVGAALTRWDQHIERLVGGRPSRKVVPFPRHARRRT
jgi:integrase